MELKQLQRVAEDFWARAMSDEDVSSRPLRHFDDELAGAARRTLWRNAACRPEVGAGTTCWLERPATLAT